MIDDCWAPQWADFAHSPQIPSDNYFDVEHEVHDPQLHFKSTVKKYMAFPGKVEIKTEQSTSETKFDDSLETESPECTNVAYFISHDNKKYMVENVKEENQLSDGMQNLEINERSSKVHEAWNIPITDLTSGFKSSLADSKVKRAMPERIKKNICKLEEKRNGVNKSSVKSLQTSNLKKNRLRTTATNNKNKLEEKLDSDCLENDHLEERLSYKVVSHAQRQPGLFKTRQYSLNKSQTRVLTCQYRRQSSKKYRRCSNKFISLAEAVSKFQNGTPQRFRTLNRNLKPEALLKLKRSPLKLTLPVSPALRCKQRSRRTNVLSTQEREQLEMEKLKRHQIKANPVPVNILKGPSVLKKITKKPATVAEEFRLTQSNKTRHTTGPLANLPQNAIDNEQKNTISATPLANTSNIVDKDDNVCTELAVNYVKTKSSSFEARNKQYRTKKEENLKNLHVQETNKMKAQFHARPAPKFSKPKDPVKEQNAKKRTVVPCPFSFETRNKSQVKKKEELVKQMEEQAKKSRVFHANPAPSFKPVTVHGVSKETLRNKEKASNLKESGTRQMKNCNDQENKQPNIMSKAITSANTKKKDTKQNIANNKPEKKEMKNKVHAAENKNENQCIIQKKAVSFELSTDKRARERSEFDEKIKKKEQELEMKKLEEQKHRLFKEKMERAQLRKMAEVKARPMPVFKPMVILKSTKLPTSPQSPALGLRKRAKSVS